MDNNCLEFLKEYQKLKDWEFGYIRCYCDTCTRFSSFKKIKIS